MEIKWLGHSCFKLTSGGYSIVIDPYEPNRVPGLGGIEVTADEVICSHGHNDHCWVQSVKIAPSGSENPFTVEKIDTFHDPEGGALRGENTVNIFSAEGMRVAHLGDLGCALTEEQVRTLGHLDAVLCPVGGFYTIDAKQAFAELDKLDLGIIVPMHYRTAHFGYAEIGTLDEFTSLFPPAQVQYLETDTFSVTPSEPRRVLVPRLAA
jgi:L-ascorbate metabolism protein UlaG (beta-lactamase superfamily)